MTNKRTQLHNYDFHSLGQEKILPDLIENDEDPTELEDLISNLDKIRSMIKKTSGEESWNDDPSINLKSLSSNTFDSEITDTWSIIARLQGLIIAPEDFVFDDLNGTIIVPSILVSNPLTGTFNRIESFTTTLFENGYIYFDLPSSSDEIIPITIINDNPFSPLQGSPYPEYPNGDRVILAQRVGTGRVWFRFNQPVSFFSP